MAGVVPQEETFEGSGGIKLFSRSWSPEGPPRGLVVVNHGFLAHGGLYQWVAEGLVAKGLAVVAHDMRGHGKSDGERFWVQNFSDYVEDLHIAVKRAKERVPGVPVFVYGHSAGGMVACMYALDYAGEFSGLICASFAYEAAVPDWALRAVKGLAVFVPRAPVLTLDPAHFSRDPAVVEAIKKDPLITHTAGPAHTVAEVVGAHDRLSTSMADITLPVLILHGTEDKATNPHGSQVFYDEVGSADSTLELYEGHFHDLLADVGKEGVLADVTGWIEARLPAA